MNVKKSLLVSVSSSRFFPAFSRYVIALDKHLTRNGDYSRSLVRLGGMKPVTLFVPGRRSGKITRVQLLAVRIDGAYHVAGSNFGRDGHPLWTLNLLSADRIATVVRGKAVQVSVEHLTGAERAAAWGPMTREWPNFDVYQERSGRELRVFRLTPVADLVVVPVPEPRPAVPVSAAVAA